MNEATRAQNEAADPARSTWLSANAGSGKTRVLTDRVARLLLNGTDPQNILCLTYTKAAAGEMQNRLFKSLGSWAMLSDRELRDLLTGLGECGTRDLDRARTLFARAIETPGGLKIQTIHSFCAMILRRFPVEAGVSPAFRELDEAGAKALISEVLERIALRPSIAGIARFWPYSDLGDLARAVASARDCFDDALDLPRARRVFGLGPFQSRESLLDATLGGDCGTTIAGLLSHLAAGGTNDLKALDRLSHVPNPPGWSDLAALEHDFLFQSGANEFGSKAGKFPSKAVREAMPETLRDALDALADRLADTRPLRLSIDAAERTAALHAFARDFLEAFEATKEARSVLDFDDLIRHTLALLSDRSLAWVQFRLDGAIDHILVDEAQDTSPEQWRIVAALAEEFAAGAGARDGTRRTLFVVGDRKQSIYSFQGADAAVFDAMGQRIEQGLAPTGTFQRRELTHSFRSSPAILEAVDAVFVGDRAAGLGDIMPHHAFHAELPGRVDLWPLVGASGTAEEPAWYDPVDRPVPNAPPVELARKVAGAVRGMLHSGRIVDKGEVRPIRPDDVLILVQRRSTLFDHLIRACKAEGVPMAGADRLKIAAELAVRDLLAVLSFLDLPEDDLSLAAALRSPILGLGERDLFPVAAERGERTLWQALTDAEKSHPRAVALLRDMRAQADFLRPYDLLERLLVRHGARRALVARLGTEAEDGIDELLAHALRHEENAVPSLTAFLAGTAGEDIEIRRQADASGGTVRVMTVHGAKGLEANIVILPDTTTQGAGKTSPLVVDEAGLALWRESRETAPERITDALDRKKRADAEERNRLLYVAMTRAAQWLIVCGTDPGRQAANNWHEAVGEGLRRLGATAQETPAGTGLRFARGDWPADAPNPAAAREARAVVLPDPDPPAETAPPPPLAPSTLPGAKALPGEAALLSGDAATLRGRRLHRLLEHLPGAADPEAAAVRILAAGPDAAPPETARELLSETGRVLAAHPDLFAEGLAEVPVAGESAVLGRRVAGVIDRLVIGRDRIRAVDFKSNAVVPNSPEEVPEGILRQLGVYLELLEAIWTDRPVELAILWTASARLMVVPHGIVRDALAATPTS